MTRAEAVAFQAGCAVGAALACMAVFAFDDAVTRAAARVHARTVHP